MKFSPSILYLLLLFCLSLATCSPSDSPQTNSSQKCTTSPLAILLQKHFQEHPYKNVNINKHPSQFDPFTLNFSLGDSTKYTISPTQIGKGHAGTVYKALNKDNNNMYVIKIVNANTRKVLREVRMLKELQDAPNFLPIRDILVDPEKFSFPFTLVFDHFHSKPIEEIRKTLTKFQMKKFIYEIFRTLDYIHSRGIMHRDIKFPNVLINPDTLEVRVIDFGISEYYLPGKQLSSRMGTLNYKAPELFLGYGFYDYSIDIWAAGVMLAEMMFRKKHIFASTKKIDGANLKEHEIKLLRNGYQLDSIAEILGTVDLLQYASKYQENMDFKFLKFVGDHKKVNWKDLIDRTNEDLVDNDGLELLAKLLIIDHTKRITAKDAMQHRFFDEIKDR